MSVYFPQTSHLRIMASAFYGLPLTAGGKPNRERFKLIDTCLLRSTVTHDGRLTDYGLRVLAIAINKRMERNQ